MADRDRTHDPEMTLIQRDQDVLSFIAEQAEKEKKPIRLRIQPQFFDRAANNYKAWTETVYIMELKDGLAAASLRKGLETFFDLANRWGPTVLATYLEEVEQVSRPGVPVEGDGK